jgi:hypothetical protein
MDNDARDLSLIFVALAIILYTGLLTINIIN